MPARAAVERVARALTGERLSRLITIDRSAVRVIDTPHLLCEAQLRYHHTWYGEEQSGPCDAGLLRLQDTLHQLGRGYVDFACWRGAVSYRSRGACTHRLRLFVYFFHNDAQRATAQRRAQRAELRRWGRRAQRADIKARLARPVAWLVEALRARFGVGRVGRVRYESAHAAIIINGEIDTQTLTQFISAQWYFCALPLRVECERGRVRIYPKGEHERERGGRPWPE